MEEGDSLKFDNPLTVDTLPALLVQVLDAVTLIVFPFVVLALVYAGFLFVSARGNESKLATARTALMYALIGGLLVLGAKALSLAVCGTVANLGANINCGVF